MPEDVVDTLNYWIGFLMSCNPLDPNGGCPEGNLASFYDGQGGSGAECGYVLFPYTDDRLLSPAGIAGVVVGVLVFALVVFLVWHWYRIRRQEKRYKKRFVQQIARNIEIGSSPGSIGPEKLSEEILHIGNGKGFISKEDLRAWMHDIKMNFISQEDFDALWNAMDINGEGMVNAVDFIVFLSACGPEFDEVYNETEKLSKIEKLKLATRRLSNIAAFGEAGVRSNEIKLMRRSRELKPTSRKTSGESLRASFRSIGSASSNNHDGADVVSERTDARR